MTPLIIGIVVAAIVLVVVVVAFSGRTRYQSDDIDSFRRQIDALSPEARRQTSERMKPPDGRSTGDDGGNGT